jgi:hypothetical protein
MCKCAHLRACAGRHTKMWAWSPVDGMFVVRHACTRVRMCVIVCIRRDVRCVPLCICVRAHACLDARTQQHTHLEGEAISYSLGTPVIAPSEPYQRVYRVLSWLFTSRSRNWKFGADTGGGIHCIIWRICHLEDILPRSPRHAQQHRGLEHQKYSTKL